MAKIDCSVTVNFLREIERMCNNRSCGSSCPVFRLAYEDSASCGYYLSKHPEFAVEIVQKWSDEHPVKTRLDDLKERFPNVSLDDEGIPCFSPSVLGYCGDCDRCRNRENSYTRNCWDEPLVGGATGKAVE